ncbi:MAG: hypothetical protein D6735_06480 [Acidobacteria bacterium]|nr:MAG: hypothetical protein D6735_06480 [Acidobacteriota bacterium]
MLEKKPKVVKQTTPINLTVFMALNPPIRVLTKSYQKKSNVNKFQVLDSFNLILPKQGLITVILN